MRVLKFGGSSVRDAERIRGVTDIVRRASAAGPVAVVVSALGGTTDALLDAAHGAARGVDPAPALAALELRHREAAAGLARADEAAAVSRHLDRAFAELGDLLHGVALLGESSPRTLDRVASYGERLSALLVAAALRDRGLAAEACDARALVRTDDRFGDARVEMETTRERVRDHFAAARALQVVTGFVGADAGGETTTLGRGGSDLTAAVLGACLEAEAIEIWTDVDGVLSADPRRVPEAFSLPRLSFEELMELSHFGAKVVYPPTVRPAREHGIPLLIRNTLNPAFPGTRIDEAAAAGAAERPITGIASLDRVSLLRLEGAGMLGVPGYARRLFGALAEAHVNVILISQASSEHSICFAVEPGAGDRARLAAEQEFAVELRGGALEPLVVEDEQCIVAVVGEGMRQRPGLAGRLFGLLGRRGVNVRAIAQGSSERNISLVLARADETRALRAIHDAFFRGEDHRRELRLVLAGVGRVGTALLAQLSERQAALAADGVALRVCGIATSRRMQLDPDGLGTPASQGREAWRTRLESEGEPLDLERLAAFVAGLPAPRALVDCTTSAALAALQVPLVERGVLVVSANKLPFSGPLAQDPRRRVPRGVYYEATVGAGLPVVGTLQALERTGDALLRLEGLFSGTLAFLLAALRAGRPLSAALVEAHRLGCTESDPRGDLSGRDVARKLLILAREAGRALEPDAVVLEPFAPRELLELDGEAFWQALPAHDGAFAERQAAARERGRALVYLATLDAEGARVGWRECPADHACARAGGADNVFVFTTRRYSETPLVVQGPGAGPELTAGGVFADLLRAHAEAPWDPLPAVGAPTPRVAVAAHEE